MPVTNVLYVGNFAPEHSTENSLAWALEQHGVNVVRFGQSQVKQRGREWLRHRLTMRDGEFDAVIYTRTHNHDALGPDFTATWREVEVRGVATVAFHLDLFVGLRRERLIVDGDPLFTMQHVFTADGGSDEFWHEHGVKHHWSPPAIDERFIEVGESDDPPIDVLFVGSGAEVYHDEWAWRGVMLNALHDRFGDRFVWHGPHAPNPAVRGRGLAALYARARVVIGDSCFAGRRARYWSDRVPETLGRAGMLLHPTVPGLDEHFATCHALADDVHDDTTELLTYDVHDGVPGLIKAVDAALSIDEHDRRAIRVAGLRRVAAEHTYWHRARAMLDVLNG